MKKILDKIYRKIFKKMLTRYTSAYPVTVQADGAPVINMWPGDTTEVAWGYKIEFDADRHIAILYDWKSDDWEYIGEVSHKESYQRRHKVDVEYGYHRNIEEIPKLEFNFDDEVDVELESNDKER